MKRAVFLSILILSALSGCQSIINETMVQRDHQEAVVNRYVDSCWNEHKMITLHEMMTADFSRNLNGINVANGPVELEAYINNYIEAFPTLKIKIDAMIQKERKVVATWSFEGINTGEFAENLPTGKKAKVTGVSIFRFNKEGKILSEDTYYNELYLLQQLGYTLQPPNLK